MLFRSRYLKAVFGIAVEWGYMKEMPTFKKRWQKEPQKHPRYVTPEHFVLIYDACNIADKPSGLQIAPPDWWRALLTMAQMTGWRIGELLALLWEDVDLKAGTALTRHDDNKGSANSIEMKS